MRSETSTSSGFSLIELMIALVVTTLIVGSIYGLLAGGQNAFRREPELSDRQQNIRVGMELIMRDVAAAGTGMPAFMQTFTPALDGVGPQNGAQTEATDELELMTNSGGFENEPACDFPGWGNSTNIRLIAGTTAIPATGMPVMIFFEDGTWTLRYVTGQSTPATGQGNCAAGSQHVNVQFTPGGDPSNPKLNQPSGVCEPNGWGNVVTTCPKPQSIGLGEVVRYRIRRDAPAAPPRLERISNGNAAAPRVVAIGVDDLQVRYWTAGIAAPNPGPFTSAPVVTMCNAPCNNQAAIDSLITGIEVTLSSEVATGPRVGDTTTRFRGRLVQVGVPRATLWSATQAAAPAVARWQ